MKPTEDQKILILNLLQSLEDIPDDYRLLLAVKILRRLILDFTDREYIADLDNLVRNSIVDDASCDKYIKDTRDKLKNLLVEVF